MRSSTGVIVAVLLAASAVSSLAYDAPDHCEQTEYNQYAEVVRDGSSFDYQTFTNPWPFGGDRLGVFIGYPWKSVQFRVPSGEQSAVITARWTDDGWSKYRLEVSRAGTGELVGWERSTPGTSAVLLPAVRDCEVFHVQVENVLGDPRMVGRIDFDLS